MEQISYIDIEYPDVISENGAKKYKSKNLGERFAWMNAFFFDYLKEYHIPAAFIRIQDKNSLRFLKCTPFPFMVKILNVVDKRTARIFSKKEGELLNLPIFEYHFGNAKDSLISESHLISFDYCNIEELKIINRICSKVNAVLKSFFERRNSILAEVTCYFGKNEDKIYLIDDFTPKSLKIIPQNEDIKWTNPYKISSSLEIKSYTEHLYHLMSI